MISIEIDGQTHEAGRDELLISVLNRQGKEIPQICYHAALGPLETCDTCIVEVNGKLIRACSTNMEAGMRVRTNADVAFQARKEAMNRILGNHELYCTICDFNNGSCEVHNATKLAGIDLQKYEFTPKPYEVDDSNPFYQYDPDQCILCGRCVEACQNVQVTETLSIEWEAEQPRVLWDGGMPINESSCVSCGHCVTVCPCNALMEKSMIGEAGHFTGISQKLRRDSIELVKHLEEYTGFAPIFLTSDAEARMRQQTIKKTKTVCTYCGVGCSFDVWTKGRDILKVEPNVDAPANGISTCIKGKFGWDYVNSPERLTTPLIRTEDGFREATWGEALDLVAERFSYVHTKHGPHAMGFIASSKATNEEAYLVQKIARGIFGTNNVDNCARYCQAPATKGLFRTVGFGGDAGTIADMQKADLVFIVGSNTAVSHPVIAAKLKRQQKLFGQYHIVADLREHEMARRADIFLRPNPGTDQIWLCAVAKYILDNGLEAKEFLKKRVIRFAEYRDSLEKFTIEFAEQETGIPAETLKQVAEKIANAKTVCGLWAMGVTQHHNGSDTSTAISNLLLITGNYGRPGTGGYPLRGHNNVQGASDFGALWKRFPGYEKVADDVVRHKWEKAWDVDEIPDWDGLNNYTMVNAAHEGDLKSLFVAGEELALVDSNIDKVQQALVKLDFFVVMDIFFSTTCEFADVILPGCASLEKDGTFVNTECRIQRLYKCFDPVGNARADWEIMIDLAKRLGHDWGYTHPSEIMDEVARHTPLFSGVSYERLEGYKSLCWPVNLDGSDTPLFYEERFNFPDGKARLYPLDWTPPHETPDEEYPLHLNNGRVLEHFHEGNMTYRNDGFREKIADAFVEVHPDMARAQGLESGDWVRLTSRRGSLKTRVVVSEEVRDGEMYMPICSSDERVNVLTASVADPDSDTPAYKEVAVKLEKLGEKGDSPVPRTNPRYGNPTPQDGVEVGRKWRRPDYVFPPTDRPENGHV